MWRRIELDIRRQLEREMCEAAKWTVELEIPKGKFRYGEKTCSELFPGFRKARSFEHGFQLMNERAANGDQICSLGTAVARFKTCG